MKMTMMEALKTRLGEPVAILCMRYWYRGFLVSVSEDLIVLSEPFAVEQSGPARSAQAVREDPIPCDVLINPAVIELVLQPPWCSSGYTKERVAEMKKKFGVGSKS